MAMNSDELGERIVDAMELLHSSQPETKIGVNVIQTPKEDGTLDTTIEDVMGRPEFNRAAITPLAYAIAQAVVEHITSHAEVDDTGSAGTPAGTWRIS